MMRFLVILLAFLFLTTTGHAEDSEEGTQNERRIDLSHSGQVTWGIQHWSGPRDGSAQVVLKRDEQFLTIRGTLSDDRPFLQMWPLEILAATAEQNLAADGLRFQFLMPQSGQPVSWCDFAMTFGSHATDPQVWVYQSPKQTKPYAIKGNKFKYTLRDGRIYFEAKIPADELFSKPSPSFDRSSIKVWLYDLDGENRLYTVLQDTIPPLNDKPGDQAK